MRQGLDVVIIDREWAGRGSTAASTSMLLWEIDYSPTQLTETYGFGRALRGDYLDHAMLLDSYGVTRAGAIVSKGGADADPMLLARGLLNISVARDAGLFAGEAVTFDPAGRSVGVGVANGRGIAARSVVLATGTA
jgi:glycine/D-amino acid oxidase-like deaminating enzyme